MSPAIAFDDLETPDDVDTAIEALYGTADLGEPSLLHVAAVWAAPDGSHPVLRINESTPRSDHDFFCLNLARARTDAIIVTGRILREEPNLHYRPQGPGRSASALTQWRARRLGKSERPIVLVLTGRGVDLDHPVFAGEGRKLVFTGPQSAKNLRERGGDAAQVVASEDSSVRTAIRHLREVAGCRTISIEAGPSTVKALYDPLAVDELMLSRFHGPALDDASVGGALPSMAELESLFHADPRHSRIRETKIEEPSGPWTFSRLRRASDAPRESVAPTPGTSP